MIKVDKDALFRASPDASPEAKALAAELAALFTKSDEARAAAIKTFNDGGDPEVSDLYKKYMTFLGRAFKGKCAYCEVLICTNQPGDVEHYRPKGRVADDKFKPIKIKHPTRGEIDHPGYYWLAYDWNNLLPSCIDCNRYRKHIVEVELQGAGKADRFPLQDEASRAVFPGNEKHEIALLINPCVDDPADHLQFLSNGTIQARTLKGEATLELLGLNFRENLQEVRANSYSDAKRLIIDYLGAVSRDDLDEARLVAKRVNRIMAGGEAYSAVQRLAILAITDRYKKHLGCDIPIPLPED